MCCGDEGVEIRKDGGAKEGGVCDDTEVTPKVGKTPDTGDDAWKSGEKGAVRYTRADASGKVNKDAKQS